MRVQRSLSGRWSFQLDPNGTHQPDAIPLDREIPVPLPWQAAFPELRRYSGYAWYQRSFEVDDGWLTGELLLDFGAVDYWCEIYVNGQCIGEHEGGYTPFRFPIRAFVHAGENTLSVRVWDAARSAIVIPRWRDGIQPDRTQPPFDPELIPHGKQSWYLDASGIWQDVTLTAVPARYIDHIHITPNIHTGEAAIIVQLSGRELAGRLRVTAAGQTTEVPVTPAQKSASVVVRVPQPSLWTPETPTLYTADVRLETNHGEDQRSERFGYREITTRAGRLLLNGQPLYLLCALDQDLYPETIYTVPSEDFLRDQFRKAKEMGLNSLRCHVKTPDPRYLELADEMGLLVWAEIPSWRTFYPKTTTHESALYLDETVKTRVRDTLRDMIQRDFNHPSLIIWTIVNEDWGTALLLSETDRAWVAEMVDTCKQLDPTRLVVDNSPCPAPWGLSVHVKSDLDDFHIYTSIPDHAEIFEQFVEQFGLRPLWSFSNTGDAQRTGEEPILVSEFGNWAMPALKQYHGEEPGWFDLAAWWSPWEGEPGLAAGVLNRFEQFGLNAIWKDYDSFAEATQWHGFNALKFEIETMRRQPAIQGYVITELSDTYWESNGLLDFTRRPKAFHDRAGEINSPDLIIPRLSRYVYWGDETAHVRLYASHYSSADWSDVIAAADVGRDTVFSTPITDMARGEVRELGAAAWEMPDTHRTMTATLALSLKNGQSLSKNEVSVLVLPAAAQHAAYGGEVAVLMHTNPDSAAAPIPTPENADDVEAVESGSFRQRLGQLGYRTRSRLNASTQLIVTDAPTAEMLVWVRAGGDLLYLSGAYGGGYGGAFFWRSGRGGAYAGNWIGSFSWLRPGVYRRLQVDNPLTLPFIGVMPQGVILGLPAEDPAVQQDFLAGQVSGWLRHPALHTVQFRYGRGRVIMTTYPLRETLAYHPVAVAMLHDLIEHLKSDQCQPVLKANY
jgi:hypothetical protein